MVKRESSGHDQQEDLLQAIDATRRIYSDGTRVRVESAAKLHPVGPENLAVTLDRLIDVYRWERDSQGNPMLIYTTLPKDWCRGLAASSWFRDRLRRVALVTAAPVLTREGELINTPGYHPTAEIYFEGSRIEPITGTQNLDRVLDTVMFKRTSDRAAALAFMLSVILKPWFPGRKPSMAIVANQAGAAKTTLFRVVATLDGEHYAVIPFTSRPGELEKPLATEYAAGSQAVLIDNLRTSEPFGYMVLESLLTSERYGHTKRNLLDYFKPSRLLCDIMPADADAWRGWLANEQKLSAATVARRVVAARTLWRKAVRWKLASENPFEGVKGGSQENESRKRFIDKATIQRVLEHAPDAELRLLIALSRYGGLRCPSEHLALRWTDIDRRRSVIVVRSAKTEHYGGHGSRQVPLFPELRPPLLDVFEQAEPGAEHVITRYREATQNLRTQFQRIIRRAGVEPWPRLWRNLRASRESELMRDYDLSTVCSWIGNSPTVAARHYATSIDRDADFRRAVGRAERHESGGGEGGLEAQQKAQQSTSART